MIYLDYAAATPVSAKAKKAMEPYFSEKFFNPSSPYFPAKQVRDDYNAAKSTIARAIGAKAEDLVITSGATESINLAFTVLPIGSEVLILATEHAAVRSAAAHYKTTEIAVDKTGLIDLADFRQKLTPNTQFVSISLANNELGTIQPLAEIAEIIKTERRNRLKSGNKTPLYLHSDASQALYLLDVNVARLGVDLLTLNAAKVYGPKGVGALYVARGLKLSPLIRGGGQEQGLRSGTENVPGVIGFATAFSEAKQHLAHNRKNYQKLTTFFRQNLTQEFADFPLAPLFLGHQKHRLANFLPLSFPGIDAERLIYHLENQEIYLSTGAACAASKGEKSKTLTAIGLTDSEIQGSLRIVLGHSTTENDLKTTTKALRTAIQTELSRGGRISCQ